ncbi:MAG: hypothetical protein GAK28_01542 [Luteibacter sp.]|nr:MAG: hypothetical protein GAK28_01542 [Luteibacter sp.]
MVLAAKRLDGVLPPLAGRGAQAQQPSSSCTGKVEPPFRAQDRKRLADATAVAPCQSHLAYGSHMKNGIVLVLLTAIVLASISGCTSLTEKRKAYLQEVSNTAGPDAADCGMFLPGSDVSPGMACAAEHLKAHTPFKLVWQLHDKRVAGDDNWLAIAAGPNPYKIVLDTTKSGKPLKSPCIKWDYRAPKGDKPAELECDFTAPGHF